MDLQCAIKVQQQRAQLKILFEGSFATFPPPTSALVEKIQQPGTWEAAGAGKVQDLQVLARCRCCQSQRARGESEGDDG